MVWEPWHSGGCGCMWSETIPFCKMPEYCTTVHSTVCTHTVSWSFMHLSILDELGNSSIKVPGWLATRPLGRLFEPIILLFTGPSSSKEPSLSGYFQRWSHAKLEPWWLREDSLSVTRSMHTCYDIVRRTYGSDVPTSWKNISTTVLTYECTVCSLGIERSSGTSESAVEKIQTENPP